MALRRYLFTSESVTEGHPDKIADQVSDAILDAIFAQDPYGRVACETLVTTGLTFVAGEITSRSAVDIPVIVREVIREIGYTDASYGFDADTCAVVTAVQRQSPDIAMGVDPGGAGDQGCLKKGTLVKTNRGFVPIEDVREGDAVATPHGFKRVLKARKTGRKRLVEIRLSNGMALACTPEHRILCYDRTGATYWKAASQLTPDDFVCVLKPSLAFAEEYTKSKVIRESFFTKYNHRVFGPEELVLDEDLGYITGELIGDGAVNSEAAMEIAFGNNTPHLFTVKSLLDSKLPNQWRFVGSPQSASLKIDSKLVRKHFENFGLVRSKAPHKRTPKGIFTSPKAVITSYLRGLFDSDGTVVANTGRNKRNVRIRLCSSSLDLLRETQLLLNDLGIRSTILFNSPQGTTVGKNGKYKSNYDNFVLSIVGFESFHKFAEEIGFLDPNKRARLEEFIKRNKDKPPNSRGTFLIPHPRKPELIDESRIGKNLPFAVVRFEDRKEMTEDDVYDLEIEDVHLFSGNGIVVHNSMFGYATKETPELMPTPILLAHKLCQRLAEVRRKGILPYLRPDGKSQVTVEYVGGRPRRVDTVVVSAHHAPDVSMERLREEIVEHVILPILPPELYDPKHIVYHINPTGRFVIGGPHADTGLTGRKIIVDTYGGVGSHGGGCFCITGDALVNTEQGLVPIKELKTAVERGLTVKTDTHPHRATHWFNNGLMCTMRVTTRSGYILEGTPNQRIRVIDSKGRYIWRRLDALAPDDRIAIQCQDRLFGCGSLAPFTFAHKPGTAVGRINRFSFPKTLTEDYAYLLGLLVGDGNCMIEEGIAICVCEEEQRSNVQALYERLFGQPGKIFGQWAFFEGAELRTYLKHLGLDYWRSWEKRVPESVFRSPRPVVAAFLRGLFDTDGSATIQGRNRTSPLIQLSSTSLPLIQDVQQLLLNFGIVSSIVLVNNLGRTSRIQGRAVRPRRLAYKVRLKGAEGIRRFAKEIGFGLPRKQQVLSSVRLEGKRNGLTIPHQRERIRRLWNLLSPSEQREDRCRIGRFLRASRGKAAKELTYAKLAEFLSTYEARLGRYRGFQRLKQLYVMGHYYDQVASVESGVNQVYDLFVPRAHTFIANGFICHNSGKDPSKVDRSASYMARYIAKNIVAAGLAEKCEVQLAYAIGVAEPVSVMVHTYKTGTIPDDVLELLVRRHFELQPSSIITSLDLRRPIYRKTATYGHFGREEPEFTWERTDKAELLREEAGRFGA